MHHDENGNGKIDKNFIGIPREPIGFANKYSPKGPPAYARALLTIDEEYPKTSTIELRRPLGKRGRIGAGLGAIVPAAHTAMLTAQPLRRFQPSPIRAIDCRFSD